MEKDKTRLGDEHDRAAHFRRKGIPEAFARKMSVVERFRKFAAKPPISFNLS